MKLALIALLALSAGSANFAFADDLANDPNLEERVRQYLPRWDEPGWSSSPGPGRDLRPVPSCFAVDYHGGRYLGQAKNTRRACRAAMQSCQTYSWSPESCRLEQRRRRHR